MREQELTGEEGYFWRGSPADCPPPGRTGCSGPGLSHGVLLPGRRSPACVSGSDSAASSLPGWGTTCLQDSHSLGAAELRKRETATPSEANAPGSWHVGAAVR